MPPKTTQPASSSGNSKQLLHYGHDGKIHNTSGNAEKHGRQLQFMDKRIYSSMNKNQPVYSHKTKLGAILSRQSGPSVRVGHTNTLAQGQTGTATTALGFTHESTPGATLSSQGKPNPIKDLAYVGTHFFGSDAQDAKYKSSYTLTKGGLTYSQVISKGVGKTDYFTGVTYLRDMTHNWDHLTKSYPKGLTPTYAATTQYSKHDIDDNQDKMNTLATFLNNPKLMAMMNDPGFKKAYPNDWAAAQAFHKNNKSYRDGLADMVNTHNKVRVFKLEEDIMKNPRPQDRTHHDVEILLKRDYDRVDIYKVMNDKSYIDDILANHKTKSFGTLTTPQAKYEYAYVDSRIKQIQELQSRLQNISENNAIVTKYKPLELNYIKDLKTIKTLYDLADYDKASKDPKLFNHISGTLLADGDKINMAQYTSDPNFASYLTALNNRPHSSHPDISPNEAAAQLRQSLPKAKINLKRLTTERTKKEHDDKMKIAHNAAFGVILNNYRDIMTAKPSGKASALEEYNIYNRDKPKLESDLIKLKQLQKDTNDVKLKATVTSMINRYNLAITDYTKQSALLQQTVADSQNVNNSLLVRSVEDAEDLDNDWKTKKSKIMSDPKSIDDFISKIDNFEKLLQTIHKGEKAGGRGFSAAERVWMVRNQRRTAAVDSVYKNFTAWRAELSTKRAELVSYQKANKFKPVGVNTTVVKQTKTLKTDDEEANYADKTHTQSQLNEFNKYLNSKKFREATAAQKKQLADKKWKELNVIQQPASTEQGDKQTEQQDDAGRRRNDYHKFNNIQPDPYAEMLKSPFINSTPIGRLTKDYITTHTQLENVSKQVEQAKEREFVLQNSIGRLNNKLSQLQRPLQTKQNLEKNIAKTETEIQYLRTRPGIDNDRSSSNLNRILEKQKQDLIKWREYTEINREYNKLRKEYRDLTGADWRYLYGAKTRGRGVTPPNPNNPLENNKQEQQKLTEKLEKIQQNELFNYMDTNKDGEISYEEFDIALKPLLNEENFIKDRTSNYGDSSGVMKIPTRPKIVVNKPILKRGIGQTTQLKDYVIGRRHGEEMKKNGYSLEEDDCFTTVINNSTERHICGVNVGKYERIA